MNHPLALPSLSVEERRRDDAEQDFLCAAELALEDLEGVELWDKTAKIYKYDGMQKWVNNIIDLFVRPLPSSHITRRDRFFIHRQGS